MDKIEHLIKENQEEAVFDWSKYSKPMQDTLDIDALRIEQNYKGLTEEEEAWFIEEIDLQESLEELLETI